MPFAPLMEFSIIPGLILTSEWELYDRIRHPSCQPAPCWNIWPSSRSLMACNTPRGLQDLCRPRRNKGKKNDVHEQSFGRAQIALAHSATEV